jgi:hypothetical protein
MWAPVTIRYAIAIAIAVATPWPTTPPSGSSSRFAIAGSPMKPIPIEAIVIPSWQAERYSSILSSWSSASEAPRSPSSRSCSSRVSRARTSANSAATKKPFAATSTRTPSSSRSSITLPAPVGRKAVVSGYFEEDLRRA